MDREDINTIGTDTGKGWLKLSVYFEAPRREGMVV
jgi:hypothetical protein